MLLDRRKLQHPRRRFGRERRTHVPSTSGSLTIGILRHAQLSPTAYLVASSARHRPPATLPVTRTDSPSGPSTAQY